MKKKTCLEMIIENEKQRMKIDYSYKAVAEDIGADKRDISKWINRERRVPEWAEIEIVRLFNIPSKYWLNKDRKCRYYVGKNKDRLHEYWINKQYADNGETNEDIQDFIHRDRNIAEQYYIMDKEKELLVEAFKNYILKEETDVQTREELFENERIKRLLLKRILLLLKNNKLSNILKSMIEIMEDFQDSDIAEYDFMLSEESINKIKDIIYEEGREKIKHDEQEVKEIEELFGTIVNDIDED